MNTCKICGNEKGNTPYKAKELLYGIGGEFEYFQCGNCGCVQIREFPADIGKYYPDTYYSLASPPPPRANLR